MDEWPAESPQTPRRRRLPIILLAVGLLAIAGTVTVLLSAIGKSTASPPSPAPIARLAGHDVCADNLLVYVETDEQMIQLADTVHNDQRARKVFTETKQEAFERFLQIFKDRPELVRSARAEALPASVTIVPTDDVDLRGWADQLRTLPAVEKVQPMITAEVLASLTPRYGTADLKPPCPSSGERN